MRLAEQLGHFALYLWWAVQAILSLQTRFLTWPRDCEFLACKQEPVVSAGAEVKGERVIPVAKKMPGLTIETSNMAPSCSLIIRLNTE